MKPITCASTFLCDAAVCTKKKYISPSLFFLGVKSNLGGCAHLKYLRPTVPIGLAACLSMISVYGAHVLLFFSSHPNPSLVFSSRPPSPLIFSSHLFPSPLIPSSHLFPYLLSSLPFVSSFSSHPNPSLLFSSRISSHLFPSSPPSPLISSLCLLLLLSSPPISLAMISMPCTYIFS